MTPTLLVLAATFAAPQVKDPPKQDDPLVGTWALESMGLDGRIEPYPRDRRWEFTADGKHFRYRDGVPIGKEPIPYTADAKADPKALDMGRILAVYKVDKDTLTVCVAQNDRKTRPTGFEVPQDTNTVLFVFRRVKKD